MCFLDRWWSSETVAIVTGPNRGIGFEIAHQLAAYGLHVIMASRDAERGRQVAEMLQNEGLNVKSHQLDISDQASVESFSKWVVLNYGGIDILVRIMSLLIFPFLDCILDKNQLKTFSVYH